jgi:hypothetical protein
MRILNTRKGSITVTPYPAPGLTNAYLIYAAHLQATLPPTGLTCSPETLGLTTVGLSQSPFPVH